MFGSFTKNHYLCTIKKTTTKSGAHHDKNCNKKMRELWANIVENVKNNTTAKGVYGNFSAFVPYLQFIRFDACEPKDWANNIADNSAFIEFEVDLVSHKVWLHRGGHVWLSPSDKATEKYKYLAMRSMVSIAEDKGVKKFRKQGWKDIADLTKKMENYYKSVLEHVSTYTNGYPYHYGV